MGRDCTGSSRDSHLRCVTQNETGQGEKCLHASRCSQRLSASRSARVTRAHKHRPGRPAPQRTQPAAGCAAAAREHGAGPVAAIDERVPALRRRARKNVRVLRRGARLQAAADIERERYQLRRRRALPGRSSRAQAHAAHAESPLPAGRRGGRDGISPRDVLLRRRGRARLALHGARLPGAAVRGRARLEAAHRARAGSGRPGRGARGARQRLARRARGHRGRAHRRRSGAQPRVLSQLRGPRGATAGRGSRASARRNTRFGTARPR